MPPKKFKAKETLKKAKPFVPPVVDKKVAKIIKNIIEKAPKRLQPVAKDETRRVGGMKVR